MGFEVCFEFKSFFLFIECTIELQFPRNVFGCVRTITLVV